MNIKITTFSNPFSFFCSAEKQYKDINLDKTDEENFRKSPRLKDISDTNHGQYVAVWWKNKWVRGIVAMEKNFLIWLVDYGVYIHPDDNTTFINLPKEFKKHPTNVFEASIHGVIPLQPIMTENCDLDYEAAQSWTPGVIARVESLIKSATNIQLMPIALLSHKNNEVVLGNLYLSIPKRGIINLTDEMLMWQFAAKRDNKQYVINLSKYYVNRRKHHACLLKPVLLENLPKITFETTLLKYEAIASDVPGFELVASIMKDDVKTKEMKPNKLTSADIVIYSNMHISIHGREYNALTVLMTKMRDLIMCKRYQDKPSLGRGTTPRSRLC